jgi:hypothetical protein
MPMRSSMSRISSATAKSPRRLASSRSPSSWSISSGASRSFRAGGRAVEKAVKGFAAAYGAKYPKAVAKITDDEEQLLAFFDLPAEHWVHLKTSNPSPPSPR